MRWAYLTGLGNATSGPTGPVAPPSAFKGTTNTPILTVREGSVLPNIIGAPAFAYYQVAMLNSQTQRISVSSKDAEK